MPLAGSYRSSSSSEPEDEPSSSSSSSAAAASKSDKCFIRNYPNEFVFLKSMSSYKTPIKIDLNFLFILYHFQNIFSSVTILALYLLFRTDENILRIHRNISSFSFFATCHFANDLVFVDFSCYTRFEYILLSQTTG